jgi:hypothetical protein
METGGNTEISEWLEARESRRCEIESDRAAVKEVE